MHRSARGTFAQIVEDQLMSTLHLRARSVSSTRRIL